MFRRRRRFEEALSNWFQITTERFELVAGQLPLPLPQLSLLAAVACQVADLLQVELVELLG